MRRQKLDEMRQAPQPGVSKGTYYNSDTYEQKRQSLNSQRREEYQNFLSKVKNLYTYLHISTTHVELPLNTVTLLLYLII